MKMIQRLLVRALMAALVTGLVAVATLILEHKVLFPPPLADNNHAADWENLGVNFDRDFPLNQDPPGVASVIDPLEPAHPRAKAVIDEEMPDASPEERAIWHDEIKRHSPDQIREMLALRRRFSTPSEFPAARDIQLSSAEASGLLPVPQGAVASAVRESADSLAVIESAIDAVESAEQVVLNNIANANSVGFKCGRALFQDVPIALGSGTRLSGMDIDASQGRLRHTKHPLHLAIHGEGYFQVNAGHGFLFARAGALSVNANGELAFISDDRARLLEPAISIPQDAMQIAVSHEGIVSLQQTGQTYFQQIGQIQLARFMNPKGLVTRGEGLFEQSGDSGHPTVSNPGADGLGEIRQGYLEESNVVMDDELAELRRLREQLSTLRRLHTEFSGKIP